MVARGGGCVALAFGELALLVPPQAVATSTSSRMPAKGPEVLATSPLNADGIFEGRASGAIER